MYFQHFILSLLLASAGAAPTSGNTTPTRPTTPTKPEPVPAYMTVAGCKALLDPTRARKTLFWSGCAKQAEKALTNQEDYDYLAGYHVMRGIFKEPKASDTFKAKFKTQKADIQETADHSFWDACSQALAGLAASSGDEAYIMTPSDKSTGLDWGTRATSHWAQHEYPIICKSTKITKLYRLDAKDPKVKEDITDLMLAQRKAGTCPPLSKVTGGGEDD